MIEEKDIARNKEKAEAKPLDLVVKHWNGVIDGLQISEANWNKVLELLPGIPTGELQNAPLQVQKALAKFKKAKFTVMIERFVEYYRKYGGLEAMKVKGVK